MTADTTAQILALEERRRQALLEADVEGLAELLSTRLRFAHANAVYDDRSSLLDRMRSGNIVYQSLDIGSREVVDLGDTALLISRLTADVLVGGQPRAIDNWTLSVWAREGGEWRLVAYQPTPVPRQ